ncbi:MAG: HAD hydrolase family protein, partial [Clostridia bacterium]|nr:HAD hydrolase family protein [Clostridia bacterium]
MSKRKLIASDFDGTIGTGARLQDDIEAIKAFQEAGHLFGMVSGRNADSLRYVCERAGINCDFRLSDSGSIYYMAGKPVFTNMIDQQVMIPLAEFLMEKETDIISVNRVDGADLLFCRNSKGEITVNVPRDQWVARPFSQMCGAFKSS